MEVPFKRYAKLPIEVAVSDPITVDNVDDIVNFIKGHGQHADAIIQKHLFDDVDHASVYVHTIEGTMEAVEGSRIVMGAHGEFYPIQAEIFDTTYDTTPVGGVEAPVPENEPVLRDRLVKE